MKIFPMMLITILFLTFLSCKNESKTTPETAQNANLSTNPAGMKVPSSCSMMTVEWLKENLDLADKEVTIKDASDPTKSDYSSCFFKWVNSESEPDAGILIQTQSNPVYDEFPEYVTKLISAKITNGESSPDGGTQIFYKKFDAGLEGAYSYDTKRFYWRNDDLLIYMLAFNLNDDEKTLVSKAEKIAAEINKNVKKYILLQNR